MTAPIEIPIPPRWQLPASAPSGLRELPGRNHPGLGAWMLEHLVSPGAWSDYDGVPRPAVIVDPFVGGGQLWMLRPPGVTVLGCDTNQDRVQIAREQGIAADRGDAQTWAPAMAPDLVAFSPPYPNCDHNAGKTPHQRELVASKGLHASQAIEPPPDMLRVFLHIASYRGKAPVAVIARNSIEGQVEVDWVSELEAAMRFAGLGEVRRFFRRIPPGPTEQWKVARGEFSAKTGKQHRVIDREWVLVAGRLG